MEIVNGLLLVTNFEAFNEVIYWKLIHPILSIASIK